MEEDTTYAYLVFSRRVRATAVWKLFGKDSELEVVYKENNGYQEVVRRFTELMADDYRQCGVIPNKCKPLGFEDVTELMYKAEQAYLVWHRGKGRNKEELKKLWQDAERLKDQVLVKKELTGVR